GRPSYEAEKDFSMGNGKPPRNWTPSLVGRFAGGGFFGALIRRLVAAAVVLGLIVAGWRYAWRTWGEPGASGGDFVVTAENIRVTPPPEWIHSDVTAEVVKSGSLASAPLRDPQLVDKVSRAFAAHSWV